MGCYIRLHNALYSGQSIYKPNASSRSDAFMQRSGNNGLLYKPIIKLDTAAKVFRSQKQLVQYWAAV